MLSADSRFDVTAVAAAEAVTLDSLINFDAVVIAPTVGVAEVAIVKSIIPFIPVVNLSSAIYEPLGVGKAINTEITDLTIVDTQNAIFEGMEAISYEGGIAAVELGNYFANDLILAKAGENVAIHAHNAGRNAYYYVPAANMSEDVYTNLIPQTVLVAAKTKRAITAVGTPAISFKQENGQSIVSITAANSSAIYYTLDGTDPTTTSTLYTEPFTLTEATTVKAFAIGDGYIDSEISTKEVTIAFKAVAPDMNVAYEQEKSIITLTGEENTEIYFNFTNSDKKDESQKYEVPFEITDPASITIFAIGEGKLQSDALTTFVTVNKSQLRWDILAHMGGEKDEWSTVGSEESRSSKVNYIFGKSAKSMYTDEVENYETVKDSLGNVIKNVAGEDSVKTIYKKVEQMIVYNVSESWKVTSYGQAMTWESDGVITTVGTAGRNPETAFDMIGVNDSCGITNMFLNFKGKASGEPYNATIQTAAKYAGPFDIIVYLCNGDKNGNYPKINVEYSADGETWTKIDTLTTHAQRFIKRNKLSYEGTDEVFVRLAHIGGGSAGQVFDIYLMNEGEHSQAIKQQIATGIQAVQPEGAVVRTEVFNLGGSRMSNAGRGLQIVRKTYANGVVTTKKVVK